MDELNVYFGKDRRMERAIDCQWERMGQRVLSRGSILAAVASLVLAPLVGCGPSVDEDNGDEPVIIVLANNKEEPAEDVNNNKSEPTPPLAGNNGTMPVASGNNQSSPPAMTTPPEATTPPPSETTPPEPETSPAELVRTGSIMETSRFAAGMTQTGVLHVFGVKSGLNEMVHRGYSPASGWTNEKFVLDTGGRPLINNLVCANSAYNRVLCSYRAGDIGGDRFIRYTFGYGQQHEFTETVAYIDDSSNNSLRHFASNYDILEDSKGSAVSVGKDNRRGTFSYWHEDSGQKTEFSAPGDNLIYSLDTTLGAKDQLQLFYIDDDSNGLVYQYVRPGGVSTLEDTQILLSHDLEPTNVSVASDEHGNVVVYATSGTSAKGHIIIGRESVQGPLGDWKFYRDVEGKFLAYDHNTQDVAYSPTLGFVVCGRDVDGYLSCRQITKGSRTFGFARISQQPILLTKPFEDDNLSLMVGPQGELHILWREDRWVSDQAPLQHAVLY